MPTLFQAGDILSLHKDTADLLLRQDHGDASLLFLHILRHRNITPPHWDRQRTLHAQGVLRGMGLLPGEDMGAVPTGNTLQTATEMPPQNTTQTGNQMPSQTATQTATQTPGGQSIPVIPAVQKLASSLPPQYTTEDVTLALGEPNAEFRALSDNVAEMLGKVLNTVDLKELLEIYSHFNLPVEVILMLVTYCCRNQEQANTSKKKPSMKDIKKEAMRWYNKGITNLSTATEHTNHLSVVNHQQQYVAQIFHMDRPIFTEKMNQYLLQWQEWGFPLDTYSLVWERTVNQLGKFDWPYANGIFKRWHEKNLHTLEEIGAYDQGNTWKGQESTPQKQMKRGPYAHDTMQGSATQAPSPQQAQRLQDDYQKLQAVLSRMDVNAPK